MKVSREKLIDIAGELDLGMKCFIHKHTQEVISFPDELMYDDIDPLWQEQIDKVEDDSANYIEIERMPSRQAFEVMQDFATQVTDNWVRNKLLQALEEKKPFAHFNALIHQMPDTHKNNWLNLRESRMIEWIEGQL